MQRDTLRRSLVAVLFVGGLACANGSVSSDGTGGSSAEGGSTGLGGNSASGGSTGRGGEVGSGGNPGTGGSVATGGHSGNTGGTGTGTGGAADSTGGHVGSGGTTGTGGATGSGGHLGTGAGSGGSATGGSGSGGAGGAYMGTKTPGTPQSGDITVDPTKLHQVVDGFGEADVWQGSSSTQMQTLLWDPVNGIGLNLLRVGIDGTSGSPNIMGAAGYADGQACMKFSGSDCKVWAAPWSPPASMKDNNNVNNGGHLNSGNYAAWAKVLAA